MMNEKDNWDNTLNLKMECPICRYYDNLKQDEWRFFIPDTPELIQTAKDHCCPSCYRMWRKIEF